MKRGKREEEEEEVKGRNSSPGSAATASKGENGRTAHGSRLSLKLSPSKSNRGPQREMKETIKYSTCLRRNPMDENEPKKAYATLQSNGKVDLDLLSEHIRDHGSVYSEGTILGVLKDMVRCAREALLQGNYVELGSLGTLKLSIASTGASSLEKFTSENIKALNVNFTPGKGLRWDITKDVDFEFTVSRKAQEAAKAAAKEGKTQANWTPEEEQEP